MYHGTDAKQCYENTNNIIKTICWAFYRVRLPNYTCLMLEVITFNASLAISPCLFQFLFPIYRPWVGRDARAAWFQSFIIFDKGRNMLRTRSLAVANTLFKGTTKRYFWGLGIFFPIRGFCRPIVAIVATPSSEASVAYANKIGKNAHIRIY